MHYLITGGSGYIGQSFIKSLDLAMDRVTILSRSKSHIPNCTVVNSFDQIPKQASFDVVINLAGSKIDRRWSADTKKDLLESRLTTTVNLVDYVLSSEQKPKLFIQASAIGFYGDYDQETLNEKSPARSSFTHALCQKWEDASAKITAHGIRLCIARLGVVLGKNSGFMQKVYWPFKLGLGGKIGSGQQHFSWIHVDDVVAGLHLLIDNEQANGVYNFTAPNWVTNSKFTQIFGEVLKRPTIFPLPSFVVKLLFGEMGEELLLKGNSVMPTKLQALHYNFKYPDLKTALQNC